MTPAASADIEHVLMSESDIATRVRELAEEVDADRARRALDAAGDDPSAASRARARLRAAELAR